MARDLVRSSSLTDAEHYYVNAAIRDTSGKGFAELGALYATEGRWQPAIQSYERAVEKGAKTASILTRLGDAQFKAHRPDSAIFWFDSALRLDPFHSDAILGRASAYSIEQPSVSTAVDFKLAFDAAQRLKDVPGEMIASDALAHLWLVKGDALAARESWQTVLNAGKSRLGDAARAGLLTQIGEARDSARQWREAEDSYNEALGLYREMNDRLNEAKLMWAIATVQYRAAANVGDLKKALQSFDVAFELGRDIRLRSSTGIGLDAVDDSASRARGEESWVLAWASPISRLMDTSWAMQSLAAAELSRLDPHPSLRPSEAQLSIVSRTRLASELPNALRQSWQVTYFVTKDSLVRWTTSPSGKPTVAVLAVSRTRLASLAKDFDRAIRTSSQNRSDVGAELASLLIPSEVRDSVRSGGDLIIVPHDVLYGVRFADLPIGTTDSATLGRRLRLRAQTSVASIPGLQRTFTRSPAAPGLFDQTSVFNAARSDSASAYSRILRSRSDIFLLRSPANSIDSTLRNDLYWSDLVHVKARSAGSDVIVLNPNAHGDSLLTAGQILHGGVLVDSTFVFLDVPYSGAGNLPNALISRGAVDVIAPVGGESAEADFVRFYQLWLRPEHLSIEDALRLSRQSSGGPGLMLYVPAPVVGKARMASKLIVP